MIRRLIQRLSPLGPKMISRGEAAGLNAQDAAAATTPTPTSSRTQKNTLVFTCTRTDSQYMIHELLPAESPAPIFLFSSRSQEHFDALMSDVKDFRYRFQSDAAERLLPLPGYDPIDGTRSHDEIIEILTAFEPMGMMTLSFTRVALEWIAQNNLTPGTHLLIRLLSTSGVVETNSNLPPSDPSISVEDFRSQHLADQNPRSAASGVKRYFDTMNASLAQGWLTRDGFATPSPGKILRVDTKNNAHRFQMQGILRDHLELPLDANSPTPVMILDESDRFIPPSLLLQALRSEKIRVVFMPEKPDEYFVGDSDERLPWFGIVVWFRTSSNIGKSLFTRRNPSKKCVGSAHDVNCDTLELNALIRYEKGVARFERLIAKKQLATRAPFFRPPGA